MKTAIRCATWKTMLLPVAAALLLSACDKPDATGPTAATTRIAVDKTLPAQQAAPLGAVLWVHPEDPARSLVVAASDFAGLTLATLDGEPREGLPGFVADALTISYGFADGAAPGALLVAHDRNAAGLRAFTIDPQSLRLRELTRAPLALNAELTGLCLYRSPSSGRHYAFVATDPGDLQQWELHAQGGVVSGRLVRSIPIGRGANSCVADDARQSVYISDEQVGIWKIHAEPEADVSRQLLELTAPRGKLGEEVKGLALLQGQGATWLLAADEDAATVHVYSFEAGGHLGSFQLEGIGEPKFESLWAGFAPAPRDAGALLVVDQQEAGALRLLRWDAIAAALKVQTFPPQDPRRLPPVVTRVATPSVETEPVLDQGDAADDPAIWIHPRDPAKSLIIGAQKKRGIEVYDLGGRRVQVLADGRTNNVDVRQGVEIGGKRRDVVAGSNRDAKTLTLYEVDVNTGRLSDAVAAPIPTGLGDPYGLCMYHSAKSGKLYVFINDPDKGDFRQWEIEAVGSKLGGKLVREFTVGTQAEGCVADDETGALYIAEEDVGLWRYGAEPDAGADRRQLDSAGEGGHLTADAEGVAIFRGKDGAGYLVLSNQGADNYAVYRREGDNAFIGHFSIVANDELGIDGASETDGLDVTSTPLGKAFPQGLVVVQDGRNITPTETQNFKLVPWERVAAALGL
jgi:3-phytase